MSSFNWDDYEEAKPGAKQANNAPSSGSFNWDDHPVVESKPGMLEAGARGAAQGATLGFGDELAGVGGVLGNQLGKMGVDSVESTHPEVQSRLDSIASHAPTDLDIYKKSRNEERSANQAAEKAHPGTSFAGNLVGGVANPLARAAGSLKGAMAYGGTQGLGSSDADLTEGDVQGAALDTGLGSGFGAAGAAVGKAIPKAIDGAKWLTKKALTTLGPSEEAITARLAGKAQPSALSYPELAEDMGGTLKTLKGQISEKSDEAAKMLSSEANLPRSYATTPIDEALTAQGKLIGSTDKQVQSVLNSLKEDMSQYGDNISERDVKTLIKKLDDNINWDDQSQNKLNQTLEGIRSKLDRTLKFQNPAYKQAIKPVSQRMAVLDNIKRQFNFRNIPGEGLQPTDTTASKVQTALRENKAVTQKNLEKLKGFTDKDYPELAKDYHLSQQFENTGPNGSRRTVLGGAMGGLLGLGTPAAIGVGAGAGAVLDRYGGKAVGNLIDGYLKAGNSAAFGKFAPIIKKAAEKGPQSLAVLSSILSSNPEFKKTMGVE